MTIYNGEEDKRKNNGWFLENYTNDRKYYPQIMGY